MSNRFTSENPSTPQGKRGRLRRRRSKIRKRYEERKIGKKKENEINNSVKEVKAKRKQIVQDGFTPLSYS
jgi:uncharacterized coiled-coil DUF342 family protein